MEMLIRPLRIRLRKFPHAPNYGGAKSAGISTARLRYVILKTQVPKTEKPRKEFLSWAQNHFQGVVSFLAKEFLSSQSYKL